MVASDSATLDYVLGGTDAANFELENDLLTVTAVDAYVMPEEYVVSVTFDETSDPTASYLSVTCPNPGVAYVVASLSGSGGAVSGVSIADLAELEAA